MDELDLLTKLRAEVPLAVPSPAGRAVVPHRLGRTSIFRTYAAVSPRRTPLLGAARPPGTPGPTRRRRGRAGRRCHGRDPHCGAPVRAAARHHPACPGRGKAMSVQLLADLAAKAAQSGPSV